MSTRAFVCVANAHEGKKEGGNYVVRTSWIAVQKKHCTIYALQHLLYRQKSCCAILGKTVLWHDLCSAASTAHVECYFRKQDMHIKKHAP